MFEGRDRRNKRADDVALALRYQLDACRSEGEMDAMVLADEDGLCLAASGPVDTCHEVAAVLPFLGRRRRDFAGTVLSAKGGLRILVRAFDFGGQELYACAIGGDETDEARQVELDRSVSGVARILAA
jgi:hypothetical protein